MARMLQSQTTADLMVSLFACVCLKSLKNVGNAAKSNRLAAFGTELLMGNFLDLVRENLIEQHQVHAQISPSP